jgi:hypothetical protein
MRPHTRRPLVVRPGRIARPAGNIVTFLSLANTASPADPSGPTVGERHHSAICRPQACVPALRDIARSLARNINATVFSSIPRGSKPPIHFSSGQKWITAFRQAPPVLRCALVAPMRRSRHGPLDFIAAARIAGPCHSLSRWPLARCFRRSAASRRRSASRVRLSVNRLANGPTKPFFR